MEWERHVENADSPYADDRRVWYTCGRYEITKEADGNYWLRYDKKPLGMGPRLKDAKWAAGEHAAKIARKASDEAEATTSQIT